MLRQLLAKKLEILGPGHPDTLSARHWIVAVLARQGMPKEAEAESRLVLQVRQQVLGAEHPSTLATRHDVARYLAEQDKVFEAEAIPASPHLPFSGPVPGSFPHARDPI
jgi:hypothetical protein